MQQLRLETGALRRLPGGTRLAIAERWPRPLIIRALTDTRSERETEEEDHDGWQPVRMRQRPMRLAPFGPKPILVRVG